jgi:hypothetical protein
LVADLLAIHRGPTHVTPPLAHSGRESVDLGCGHNVSDAAPVGLHPAICKIHGKLDTTHSANRAAIIIFGSRIRSHAIL